MWIKFRHENSKRRIFVPKEAQAETWKQQRIIHGGGQGSLASGTEWDRAVVKFMQILWPGHRGLGGCLRGLNMTELIVGSQRMLCQG